MTERQVPLPDRRATKLLARAVSRQLAPGDLFVLTGPLGAGKTFFVRAVCRAMGLDRSVRVTSPTFTLVNEYATVPPLVHADLYRLDATSPEATSDPTLFALAEQRDEGRVLFVEWGGPFIDMLGGDAILIDLTVTPRSAHITATGPRSRERVEAL
ncbi:MAG TPA: tRNA (adenosine(37)-N6)-threonylcarbamoyltransferase complex ATPase subunit type 1 TsaE [Polyangiaceae bacterium]|nr:tRNA (adenosine(37)-N6)-threonylcarbamoyltransferase complex ATPase subunit type 1 TsaE [Polyangiaceae bacterium]